MIKQKISILIFVSFLLLSLSATPLSSAVNISGANAYSLYGGFTDQDGNHVASPHGYVYNGTVCTPYVNGSATIGGTVYVDSNYMDYTFYGNITYADLSLFQGTYTVYLGQQSNVIATALDFSQEYIWDSGSILLEDTFYSGYSGALDDTVFTWFSNLPPFSTLQGTTYLGIKYNFVNATAGVNYNVIYLIVIDGYLGQNAFGTPNPTFSVDFGSGTFPTDVWGVIAWAVGLVLSFIGLVVLMKAPGAWMPGIFLVVVGLVVCLGMWTNLFSLVGWGLVVLLSPIFLYSGGTSSRR